MRFGGVAPGAVKLDPCSVFVQFDHCDRSPLRKSSYHTTPALELIRPLRSSDGPTALLASHTRSTSPYEANPITAVCAASYFGIVKPVNARYEVPSSTSSSVPSAA